MQHWLNNERSGTEARAKIVRLTSKGKAKPNEEAALHRVGKRSARTADCLPGPNEHADRLRGGLDGRGDAHNHRAEEHCGPATNTVCHVWCEGVARQTANVLFQSDTPNGDTVERLLGWH